MSDSIDLALYLKRVGHLGPCLPMVATLHALTAAHTQAIAFENIDVLLQRPLDLTPDALFKKIVLTQRGGYCFEQNGLFLQVLMQLGFQARPLGARVRLGTPDRRITPGRTHMLLEIAIDGAHWITDVGIGGASLTRALPLTPGEHETPHDKRRLERHGAQWFHQIWRSGQWVDVYEFTRDDFPMADRRIANWYTSTHPDSHFTHDLTVARALPHGERLGLSNFRLTRHAANGATQKTTLSSATDLLNVLRDDFDIEPPPETLPILEKLT